jgi:two-component system cell cycle sensor histidine kinase/response regulator CckA
MLAISDTGVGMSADVQSHLFEPFFTTKPQGEGTGLGLATSYGIIRQHRGYVWVYSEVGRGTTLKIHLPATTEAPQKLSPTAAARETLTSGTETILLAEDEDAVRAVARDTLKRCGYVVIEATGGGEALLIAARYSGPIHLLVTDVVMPQMNGRELAERLRQDRPALRVLYVSGYTENTVSHHGVLDAGVGFLGKPFRPSDLATHVRQALDA